MIGLYLAFAIPIWLRWRHGDRFEVGSWNNGAKYKWMNLVAVAEIVIVSVYLILPFVPAGEPAQRRLLLEVRQLRADPHHRLADPALAIWWQVSAKKWFTGPKHEPSTRPWSTPSTTERVPTDDELEALLDRVPVLAGPPAHGGELPGGLTNQNLHVTTRPATGRRRFRGDGASARHRPRRRAPELRRGRGRRRRRVVDYRPDLGMLVIEFIRGRTYENATFAEPGVIERVAHACRRLHEGPRFNGDFDMFRRQARYRRTVAERGFRLFDGYDDFDGDFRRVRGLAPRQEPTVPCNNDLLAGNFVDDGRSSG